MPDIFSSWKNKGMGIEVGEGEGKERNTYIYKWRKSVSLGVDSFLKTNFCLTTVMPLADS